MSQRITLKMRTVLAICAPILLLSFMVNSCHATDASKDNSSEVLISKEAAVQKIIESAIPQIESISLTVHQYPTLLDAGSKVKQANPYGSNELDYLLCEHKSWLFFFDLASGAHYAHPTKIVLLDATNGDIKIMDSEWWPVVEAPIFDSVEEREEPDLIVFER
jgi:hypothetical protein